MLFIVCILNLYISLEGIQFSRIKISTIGRSVGTKMKRSGETEHELVHDTSTIQNLKNHELIRVVSWFLRNISFLF